MKNFVSLPNYMAVLRTYASLALKLLFSLVLFIFIFQKIDLRDILLQLRDIQIAYLGLALILLWAQFTVGTYRWKLTLDALHAPIAWPQALRCSWIGLFFNQALPASIGGDGTRLWLLHKQGRSLGLTLNSILIGHMGMLTGLLMTAFLSLLSFSPAPELLFLRWFIPLLLTGLIASIALICLWGEHFPRPFPLLKKHCLLFAHQSSSLFLFTLLSLLNCWLLVLSAYLIGLALGANLPFMDFCRLMPLVIIVSVLPISIGGWGPREVVMIQLFAPLGLTANTAFTLSALLAILTILVSLPGAWFYLTYRHPPKPQ